MLRTVVFALGLAACAGATKAAAQSELFYRDDTNFVYREAQSCALYVDYEDDVMLRVSYRRHEGAVFVSLVGGPWNGVSTGQQYMVQLAFTHEPNYRQAFVALGFEQPGDDERRGVAAERGEELLPLFRAADGFYAYLGSDQIGGYGLGNMPTAIDKLISCSTAYFSVAPK